MTSLIVTIIVSILISAGFIIAQACFFRETKKYRQLYENFFSKTRPYCIYDKDIDGETIPQLKEVGKTGSDIIGLIKEINHYIVKTKGTTDFSVIQNKVERKISMRYEQATSRLSFPTYFGLMGTFTGVFIGIFMFILGFDGAGNISDDSIENLLIGVLVSMLTSLIGLALTTRNNWAIGKARTKIEEDKNEFYDFIQTELMPSIDVSMVSAITKLHETVDRFEPAFDKVINRFQSTFDRCTKAFGDDFEKHVNAVSYAVQVMGSNMDSINQNISLQEKLIATLKSNEIIQGLDKYVEAANHFVGITKALDKFEEARRMMLAAAQESIEIQNCYNESLKIPRAVAIKINGILDRITGFEQSLKEVGNSLTQRDILGNEVIESIKRQIQGISKKSKIADKFLEISDGKLEDLYKKQTKALDEMNDRYRKAIEGHIEGFEDIIEKHTQELEQRHVDFIEILKERFNIEDIKEEFTNLHKLGTIEQRLSEMIKTIENHNEKEIHDEVKFIERQIQTLKIELEAINKNTKNSKEGSGFFGFGRR